MLDGSGYCLKQAQTPYGDRYLNPNSDFDSEKVKHKQGVSNEISFHRKICQVKS